MQRRIYKLDSLCEITSSKRIFYSEYADTGIPFYRSKEIIDLFNRNDIATELFISEERYNEIKSKFGVPVENDLLLTSVGTIGIPYLVKTKDKFYFKDGNLTWFRKYNRDLIVPLYLYLWISSNVGKQTLTILSMGAAQPALTISRLKKLCINLPPVETQQKIASVLSTYDTLIENNTKRIRLLELMAENLYKEWFVRFRFPGHENVEMVNGLPKGWKVERLENFLEIKYGKDHKHVDDGDIPILGSGGIMRYGNSSLYSGESVLIPRKGTLNNIMYQNGEFWTVDTMFYTIPKIKNVCKYMYYVLSAMNMDSLNPGAALPSMTTNILNRLKIVLPPEVLLASFETLISPIYKEIKFLHRQSSLLTRQRDLLLPRLMSGKLEVKQTKS